MLELGEKQGTRFAAHVPTIAMSLQLSRRGKELKGKERRRKEKEEEEREEGRTEGRQDRRKAGRQVRETDKNKALKGKRSFQYDMARVPFRNVVLLRYP